MDIKKDYEGLATLVGGEIRHYWDKVVDTDAFWISPGSSNKHHNWTGGLAQHTLEVIRIALRMAQEIPEAKASVLLVAGLWHDYGKIWSYRRRTASDTYDPHFARPGEPQWEDSPLKDWMGGHLAKSYGEYLAYARKTNNILTNFDEEVLHCILAHHGQREWGSPARPCTREAWILHLADSASARCLGKEVGDVHAK